MNTSAMHCFYAPSVQSTQTLAKERLATIASDKLPFAACAGEQSAGRGKGARVWAGAAGNIACSIAMVSPDKTAARVTIAAGLALHHMLTGCVPAEEKADLRIKWPNDIYRAGKKIAGMLTEIIPAASSANRTGKDIAIVGIGVNMASAPTDVPDSAALYAAPMPLGAGFAAMFAPFFTDALALDDAQLNERWLPLSYPQDKCVIYKGKQRRTGTIMPDGALLLFDNDGRAAETITDSDGLVFTGRSAACY